MNSMRAVFTSFVLLTASPALAQGVEMADSGRTLSVRGDGIADVIPDQAVITLTAYGEAINLTEAKQEHDRRLTGLLKSVKAFNIPDDKIRTSYASIQPMYDYNSGKQVFKGYAVSSTIDCTVTKIDTVADFIQKTMQEGIDRMGNVAYGVSDERKAQEDALLDAFANAKQKATRLASLQNLRLGKVLFIAEQGTSSPQPPAPMPMMRMATASMEAAAPSLPAGNMRITSTVTVTYELQ